MSIPKFTCVSVGTLKDKKELTEKRDAMFKELDGLVVAVSGMRRRSKTPAAKVVKENKVEAAHASQEGGGVETVPMSAPASSSTEQPAPPLFRIPESSMSMFLKGLNTSGFLSEL